MPYRGHCAPSFGNPPPLARHGLTMDGGVPYGASASTPTPRTKERPHTVMPRRARNRHSTLRDATGRATASGAPPRERCSCDSSGTPSWDPKRERGSRTHWLASGGREGLVGKAGQRQWPILQRSCVLYTSMQESAHLGNHARQFGAFALMLTS